MSYPFVHARYDYGVRKGPALAFVIHHAEGGNTVAYLANDPPRGVSVHYVLDVRGRVTRMLAEDHASGSINPTELRTSDDTDGLYGATAAKAALGTWWRDPNSAVISLEIEGFAAQGPNALQVPALIALVNDVRSRHPDIALLGHRDFTTTKACPGHLIPWDRLGGHGKGDMPGLKLTYAPTGPITGSLVIPPKTKALRVADGTEYTTTNTIPTERSATTAQIVGGSGGYLVELHDDELHFIYNGWLPADPFTEATRPADPAELANAKAAGRESFRHDVEALP